MKVKKTVILVTHGEKEKGPNPGMTEEGFKRVAVLLLELDKLLPNGPTELHFGSGQRHIDVVKALGFSTKDGFLSDLWGGPGSLEKTPEGKIIVLADGTAVAFEKCYTIRHLGGELISKIIAELPGNSVICSGRPVLVRLGRKPEECESGAIYALRVMDDGSIEIELLVSGVNLADGGAEV